MTRSRRSVLLAPLACLACLICVLALAALALGAKKREPAPKPSGNELSCPAQAVIGEPFVVRVRLRQPAAQARLSFLGRSAPLVLRRTDSGMEASALLGADVLDARPGRQPVTLRVTPKKGGKVRTLTAHVELLRVERPVERLSLDPAMVTPPDEELPRIARERALARQALGAASPRSLWSLPLLRPVPGAVSSVYGIGRILNGQPRAPHRGLDLEAETGEPVLAAADGVVALTGGFYYAGNCVYLDHGQGLTSMYLHLSEVRVAPGQRVAQGEVLGLAGDTGRSTRSHLHFGVAALGRLVDPEPLFLYDASNNARETRRSEHGQGQDEF